MTTKFYGYVLSIAIAVLLSSCGSGGGGGGPRSATESSAGIEYPPCLDSESVGVVAFAGCWISEQCSTDIDNSMPVRYMAEIIEHTFTPVITGDIHDYRLFYDNKECAGEPIEILSMDEVLFDTENAVRKVHYEQISFAICEDTDGRINIPCLSIDITSTFQRSGGALINTASKDTYWGGDIGKRLCLSASTYTFDDRGNGGIGVGALLQDRDTLLDFTHCLSRFEPPLTL